MKLPLPALLRPVQVIFQRKSADVNMKSAQIQRDAGIILESDFLSARVIWAGLKEEEIKALNAVQLSKAPSTM